MLGCWGRVWGPSVGVGRGWGCGVSWGARFASLAPSPPPCRLPPYPLAPSPCPLHQDPALRAHLLGPSHDPNSVTSPASHSLASSRDVGADHDHDAAPVHAFMVRRENGVESLKDFAIHFGHAIAISGDESG